MRGAPRQSFPQFKRGECNPLPFRERGVGIQVGQIHRPVRSGVVRPIQRFPQRFQIFALHTPVRDGLKGREVLIVYPGRQVPGPPIRRGDFVDSLLKVTSPYVYIRLVLGSWFAGKIQWSSFYIVVSPTVSKYDPTVSKVTRLLKPWD